MWRFAVIVSCVLVSVTLSANNPSLNNVEEFLRRLEIVNDNLREELKTQESLWQRLKDILNNQDHSLEKRQGRGCIKAKTPPAVVFSTRLSNTLYPLGKNQIVTYDDIVTNEGNGYDKITGIFEAPVEGLYQIIATMWSSDGYSVDIEMIHNGDDVCYAKTTTRNSTMGTCATVLMLQRSDRVWVRHLGTLGNYAYGTQYATFAGHLVM